MKLARSLISEVNYAIDLLQGGWSGAVAARKTSEIPAFPPALTSAVWAPAAIGAAVGAWGTFLNRNRRSRSNVVLGGLAGSALGLGCAVAWASRGFTGVVARSAVRRINSVRDARWLVKNPIDYA